MKINELGLTFDDKGFYNDLISAMVIVVKKMSEELKKEMSFQATMDETKSSLKYVVEHSQNMIVSYVGADHWKAFIDAYGRGSLMTTDNPWLQEYFASGWFNSERAEHGNQILARRYGVSYEVPDWETGRGTITKVGKYKGEEAKVLEGTHKKYDPRSASFFIETSLRHIEQQFSKLFWGYLSESFSFSSYLKGGRG